MIIFLIWNIKGQLKVSESFWLLCIYCEFILAITDKICKWNIFAKMIIPVCVHKLKGYKYKLVYGVNLTLVKKKCNFNHGTNNLKKKELMKKKIENESTNLQYWFKIITEETKTEQQTEEEAKTGTTYFSFWP